MPKKKKQSEQPPFAKRDEQDKVNEVKLLEKWRRRVAIAVKLRSDWERDYQVEDCENFFLGRQLKRTAREQDLVLNHFRATIKTMVPNLVYTAPKFFVRPKSGLKQPAEELNASTGEGVLDAIATQDQNLKRAARLGTLQAFFRVGCLKAVYDPKLEPNPRAGEPVVVERDGGPLFDEQGQPVQARDPLTGKILLEPDRVMTDEVYRYAWVDAKHLLLPDEGPDRAKWSWIGEEITVPLDDAKEDTRFPESLRDQLESNTTIKDKDMKTQRRVTQNFEEDKLLKYIEVWDHKEKRRLVWADGQIFDKFLLDEPLPPGIESDPYSILSLGDPIMAPDPLPWPVPKTRSWLDPQRSYNVNRKQVDNGSRRAARKGYYTEGMFTSPEEVAKALQNPDDLAFAMVNDINQIPKFSDEPNLSNDIYRSIALTLADWRTLTGQTGARLATPESDTATEATFVERAAGLRDADDQDLVNDWLSETGSKMYQLVQQTLTMGIWIHLRGFSDQEIQKYLARIHGIQPEQLMLLQQQAPGLKDFIKARFGQAQMRRVTREALTFQADVTVEPGSARPKNLAADQFIIMKLVPMILQNPGVTKVPSLVRRILKAFDIVDERLIEELQAVGDLLIGIAANQAGRNQGNGNSGAGTGSTAGNPNLTAQLAGIQQQLGKGA